MAAITHQSGLVRLKSWFSNTTGTSVNDEKARDGTSGAQFAALPLVKPVAWFAGAVVNWRPRSVAKSDKPSFGVPLIFEIVKVENAVQPILHLGNSRS